MTPMENVDKIFHGLASLPDQILEHYLPDFSPAVIRQTLMGGCQTKQPSEALSKQAPTSSAVRTTANLLLYTDGASRGNPGMAGAGAVILDDQNQELCTLARYLGSCTNNVAEYQALILGLSDAVNLGGKNIHVFLDSQLIVRQVQGIYKVKNKNLQPLFAQVKELLAKFDSYQISHVPREQNKRADELANRGIDER